MNLQTENDNRSKMMVENFKGGERLLKFDSATSAGLDNRAFARWAATFGVDSAHIASHVPANPSPTRLQVLNHFNCNGHLFLGGTNVQI